MEKTKKDMCKELAIRTLTVEDNTFMLWSSPQDMINTVEKAYSNYGDQGFFPAYHYKEFLTDPYSVNTWALGRGNMFPEVREELLMGSCSKRMVREFEQVQEEVRGEDRVRKMVQMAESVKRHRIFREEGAELCVDRVMCGDPQHWSKLVRGKQTPVVKININCAQWSGGNEKTFLTTMAMGAVASDILTMCGYNVEITCSYVVYFGDDRNKCERGGSIVMLKSSEEVMDIKKVLSAGNMGLYRVYEFDARCLFLPGRNCSGSPSGQAQKVKDLVGWTEVVDTDWSNTIRINDGKSLSYVGINRIIELLKSVTGIDINDL